MKSMKVILITSILFLITTFAFADPLLFESFEVEWNTTSPWGPVGWSESAVASGTVIGDSDWDRDDNSNATEGEYIAYMYQDDDPTDDWLITPAIDLTANSGTDYLEYYIRIRYGLTAGDYLYIMISTDGGSLWNILKTYDDTNTAALEDYPLTQQVVDLSAYNDQTNVKIGFYGDYNVARSLRPLQGSQTACGRDRAQPARGSAACSDPGPSRRGGRLCRHGKDPNRSSTQSP